MSDSVGSSLEQTFIPIGPLSGWSASPRFEVGNRSGDVASNTMCQRTPEKDTQEQNSLRTVMVYHTESSYSYSVPRILTYSALRTLIWQKHDLSIYIRALGFH